jgi:hypothetical protein
MNREKLLKFAVSSMIAGTVFQAKNAMPQNINNEVMKETKIENRYVRKEPVDEKIMTKISNMIGSELGSEIKNIQKFDLPSPSLRAVVDENRTGQQNYASRELKMNETIKYYNFKITLYRISYTFKEISATFIITTGEEEWKETLKLNEEKFIDYRDIDNEKVWRLKIKLKEIKAGEGKVVINLMQKEIQPDQIGKPDN